MPAASALAVGASYNSSLTATMPNGTNGSFHIIVVTDAADHRPHLTHGMVQQISVQ